MSMANVDLRNRFRGRVISVDRGPQRSDIEIDTGAAVVCASIDNDLASQLSIQVGDETLVLFKACAVKLAKPS